MRVISGIAKGRKLIAPEGLHTRPITDQIKEALFDMWQFRIDNSCFLDLFSGSGSMGIEAISRGASKVIMVDNDNNAINVIKTNLQTTKLTNINNKVIKGDVFNVVKDLENNNETFDIIYLDPPFTVDEIFHPVMEALSSGKLLKDNGIIALRSAKEKKMYDNYGNLIKYKERKYGISMIHFYKLKEND